ncbi:PKD domain-containing protein [Halorussus pelagicus]|uniref:PKD domain-containing protein n=1 Tax=Halorussus pelagicus TaxID=2505977 RepID=UPI000FFC6EED|nr:PKD domain-containing protein [Halorussus pelagicus]
MNADKTALLSLTLAVLLVASVLPANMVGMVGTARADHEDGPVYTVRQPGTSVCYEIAPYSHDHPKMVPEVEKRGTNTVGDVTGPYRDSDWNGFESIESIMDYRYHDGGRGQTEHYAPYLNTPYMNENWEYSTYGLYNWSHDGDSHMFFYENANGEVSLVVRHDRLYDHYNTASHRKYNGLYGGIAGDGFHESSPDGGRVSWEFRNLPEGEWAYIDDMYPRENLDDVYTDGDGTRYGHREAEYDSEPLREFSGGTFDIDWRWGDNRTDGGAYRGFHNLGDGEQVTIDPETFRNVDRWEVRDNTGHDDMDGELKDLRMDRPVVIERGANCLDASISADRNPAETGESVTFTAGSGAEGYRWDFDGDGEIEENTSARQASYTYNDSGTREATVTMVEGDRTLTASTTVEVGADRPPTADFDATSEGDPATHVVGESVAFDGSASSDNVAISRYEWDLNGSAASGDTAERTFSSPGEKTIRLTVTDRLGNTDNATKRIEIVETDDPEASASADPTTVEAGAPIPLNGTQSSDGTGVVESYEWRAPGGDVADPDANETSVTFESAGDYRVNLTVTDTHGNTDTDGVNVTVTNATTPTIDSVSVEEGEELSVGGALDASASASDESTPLTYEWLFRQGGDTDSATGESVRYEGFDQQGSATVELVVTDAAGQRNSTGEIGVQVTDKPSAALSVTNETRVGESVTFDASNSTDASGESPVAEYRWDFDGDGEIEDNTTGENATATHEYGSADTYEAAVTVADDGGDTDTATTEILVKPEEKATGGGGGGGGGGGFGPPPILTETTQTGANSAAVDVRQAQDDRRVKADLPASAVGNETGVQFARLAVEPTEDDAHIVFQTAASADAPDGTAALTATDESLAYFGLDAEYLDSGVESATVGFAVERSAVGALNGGDDVSVYQYDDGWRELDATVAASSADGYRVTATTDSLGALAVGADRSLSASGAELSADTVATGGDVTANVTVENAGTAPRSATVNLTADGSALVSKEIEVPAGERTDVTLSGSAPSPGTYETTVGGASAGTLTVKETLPADISVTDVALNASTIAAGERVEITATVENTGNEVGEWAVALTMFGEQLANESARVPAGETKEVTFVQRVDAGGNYTVDVNGETAELGVTESSGGFGDDPPGIPGFGVGAALVALASAMLVARLGSRTRD